MQMRVVGVMLAFGSLVACGEAPPTDSENVRSKQEFASTPPTQRHCGQSYGKWVPVDIGAYEFDKDLHNIDVPNYGLNERFKWPLYVSSNVRWMNPHFREFNTVPGDYLRISVYNFEGDIGTGWYDHKMGPNGPNADHYNLEWNSDGADTLPGYPGVDKMRFQCKPDDEQELTAPIHAMKPNQRYDGVFFNPHDVLYFSVTQPSLTPLAITLDVNAATSDADFDVYASSTASRPNNNDYEWADESGSDGSIQQAGGYISVGGSVFARTIYIGVVNYSGLGHFSIRGNVVEPRTLTICTQDMDPIHVKRNAGWPNVDEAIRRTLLRVLQLTNGNLLFGNVVMKTQSSGLQSGWDANNAFCDADPSCDWCMDAYGLPPTADGCGYQTQASTGRMRIPNVRCQGDEADHSKITWGNPQEISKVLAHETGHALKRMRQHVDVGTLLDDQYLQGNTGLPQPQDAHTIMNGPYPPWVNHTSYRFSTDYNHCKPNDPVTSPKCTPYSDWTTIERAGFPWIYPKPNYSAQPWLRLEDNHWAAQRAIISTIQ